MKSRFALPVVIALSLEAVLLLCFNRPGVASAQPPPRPPSFHDTAAVPYEEPSIQQDDTANGGQESPRPVPPSIPEPPVVPRIDGVTQVASPEAPPNVIPMDRVPPGIGGTSIGDGTGPGGILPAAMLDNEPRVLHQRAPKYPYEAARDQRSGEVLVEFSVDEAGRVFNPIVVRSTDPVFDEPTLRAVLQWRFEPGRRDGRAVRFRMRLPVEFHQDGN
jgi:periplasmic protein TonB